MPIMKGFSLGKVQKTEKEKGPLTVSRIPFPLFNFQLNNTFLFIAYYTLLFSAVGAREFSLPSLFTAVIYSYISFRLFVS